MELWVPVTRLSRRIRQEGAEQSCQSGRPNDRRPQIEKELSVQLHFSLVQRLVTSLQSSRRSTVRMVTFDLQSNHQLGSQTTCHFEIRGHFVETSLIRDLSTSCRMWRSVCVHRLHDNRETTVHGYEVHVRTHSCLKFVCPFLDWDGQLVSGRAAVFSESWLGGDWRCSLLFILSWSERSVSHHIFALTCHHYSIAETRASMYTWMSNCTQTQSCSLMHFSVCLIITNSSR